MFFFFKQKTAYEMRISDWSSDVCSSDLRHAAVAILRQRAEQAFGRARGADRLPQIHHRLPEIARARIRRDRLGGVPNRAPRGGQIGRASCRERVWTYV